MNNSVFVRSQENRQKKPPKEELRLLLRAERKNSPDFRGNFVKSLKKNYDSLMLLFGKMISVRYIRCVYHGETHCKQVFYFI